MDNILKLKKINNIINNLNNNNNKEPIKLRLSEKLQTPIILKDFFEDKDKDKNPISKKKKDSLAYELKTIKETINSKDNEFLCKAFFTTGIPNINPEIINDSENSMGSCNHKECSILPSIKPEILNKFPNKSNKFDLNATVIK